MSILDTAYEVNKKTEIRGVEYLPGDPIDVSWMPEHKVGQLLNQRFIRPARPVEPDPDT